MKPNRPASYMSWVKRLNCEPAAIASTTYYRMRLNMRLINRRPLVRQIGAQNEPLHPNTNHGIQLFNSQILLHT